MGSMDSHITALLSGNAPSSAVFEVLSASLAEFWQFGSALVSFTEFQSVLPGCQ